MFLYLPITKKENQMVTYDDLMVNMFFIMNKYTLHKCYTYS